MTRIPKPVNSTHSARPSGPRTSAPTPPTTPPNLSNVANQSKLPVRTRPPSPPQGVSSFTPPAAPQTAASQPVSVSRERGANGLFPQGACPPMGSSGSSNPRPLELDKASCLTHGMDVQHVQSALTGGQLHSAYSRLGKDGAYSRDADKNGGGALAVYTRAVGTEQTQWKAQGHGVGSNPNKVQFILSPALLQAPDHSWRASGMDNMGKVPSSTANDQRNLPKNDPLGRAPLWGKQTEAGRNSAFNATLKGPLQENNEQLHWEKVPLQGNLKGMVVSSQSTFDTLMQLPDAQRTAAGRGTVRMGDQDIKVVLTQGKSSLVNTLKQEGIADANGRVR
jgi:hypothetical protein